VGIDPYHLGFELAFVHKTHHHLGGLRDYMVVGEDIAFGRDDHTGSKAPFYALPRDAEEAEEILAEELPKEGILPEGRRDAARSAVNPEGRDVDHRRNGPLGGAP